MVNAKDLSDASSQAEAVANFSSSSGLGRALPSFLDHKLKGHLPSSLSHILAHFPLVSSGVLPSSLVRLLFSSRESFGISFDDSSLEGDSSDSFSVLSPSLDFALVSALECSRCGFFLGSLRESQYLERQK